MARLFAYHAPTTSRCRPWQNWVSSSSAFVAVNAAEGQEIAHWKAIPRQNSAVACQFERAGPRTAFANNSGFNV